MARPPRVDIAGGVYHVIARGNERKDIFRDDEDRRAYLDRLADCRARLGFFVYAYCLMSNHVHLVLERGPTPLSRIMLNLHSFHGQRFNRCHQRVGHLFAGRYKAFLVQRDRYLLALLRYVHRNPVEADLVRDPSRYRWSSDRFYRRGAGPDWLDLDRVLPMLGPRRSAALAQYRRLVDEGGEPPYVEEEAISGLVQGDEEFAVRVLRAKPPERRRNGTWTVELVAKAVASAEGIPLWLVRGRGQGRAVARARAIAGFLAHREGGIQLASVARYLGRDQSTLTKAVFRIEAALSRDASLRARLRSLTRSLEAESSRTQA